VDEPILSRPVRWRRSASLHRRCWKPKTPKRDEEAAPHTIRLGGPGRGSGGGGGRGGWFGGGKGGGEGGDGGGGSVATLDAAMEPERAARTKSKRESTFATGAAALLGSPASTHAAISQCRAPNPTFTLVESSRASPPHRLREDGLTHPADTSRSNLARPWVCFPNPNPRAHASASLVCTSPYAPSAVFTGVPTQAPSGYSSGRTAARSGCCAESSVCGAVAEGRVGAGRRLAASSGAGGLATASAGRTRAAVLMSGGARCWCWCWRGSGAAE
jgi:hypothetical protein